MAKGKISLTIDGGMKNSASPIEITFNIRRNIMNKCTEMYFYHDKDGNYHELPVLQEDCQAVKIAKGIQEIPGVINTEDSPIYISDRDIQVPITDWCDIFDVEASILQIIEGVLGKPLAVKRLYEEG